MPKSVSTQGPLADGVVVALHRKGCVVECGADRFECKREKGADLCIGDEVQIETLGQGRGAIREQLPRRTWFVRGLAGGRQTKLVAANADVLAIVVSAAEPPLQPGLIDRFLVLAELGRMGAILCMNKMDLADAAAIEGALEPYVAAGIPVFRMTAPANEGIADVRDAIQGKRVLFCGHSGVGKSTLINALAGDHERLRTGEISSSTGKGTHTTTWVDWIDLDADTVVIDTPGIRQLSLAMLGQDEIAAGFAEFAAFIGDCRYVDCRHVHEHDCAVHAAALRREIHPTRYARYRAILQNP